MLQLMDKGKLPPSEVAEPTAYADLAIYDDVLPSPASPFRTLEYGHYLDFFPSSVLVSLEAWHFGFAHSGFGDLRGALPIDEAHKRRIISFDAAHTLVPRLAYITFQGNAQRLLPYLEGRQIPFILQLYPGGSFEPNVEASDNELRKIVHSPLCRKIIATQKLTLEHLVNQIGCDPAKTELIYGGVFESRVGFDFARDKRLYGRHKETIDICFVAHRYGGDMAQKGYDQFVEIAHLLADDPRLRFHVVGDYTPDDLPLGPAEKSFVFYGAQPSSFFADFYPGMDVILSANRPVNGRNGAFDGFPTGACMEAGFRGVLNCIADPLELNVAFEDGREILLIDRNASRTATRLRDLFANPDRLYEMSRANYNRFRDIFDVNRQLWARTRLIVSELLREERLVARPSPSSSILDAGEIARALAVEKSAERRHDNLLMEYKKLAAGFERVKSRHSDLQSRYNGMKLELKTIRSHAAKRERELIAELREAKGMAGSARSLAKNVLRRFLPEFVLRMRRRT